MPNVIDPQFGVQISADELRYHTPVSIIYGVTPTNKFMPVRISNTGELIVGAIVLEASDIQIGAVEIKNHDTDDRVFVSTDNEMRVESRLHDEAGTGITSTLVGPKQGIDVNVIGGGGGLTDADDDDIAPNQPSVPLAINLNYAYNGTNRWERVLQTAGSLNVSLRDGLGVALTSTLVSGDQALDVNVVQTTTAFPSDADDGSITAGQTLIAAITLPYGFNGVDWERTTTIGGALNVNFANSTFNVVSTLNSTTTPLGVSGVFTGTFEDILKFGHLTVMVMTDAADSVIDGLEIQWSSDGVTIDDTDKFTIGANESKIYTFGPQSKFFRIKYTNNTTAQTTFTIHTVLKQFSQKPSSHRIGEFISSEDDAELVKSVLSAKDINTGLWQNIESEDGRLLVDATIVPSLTSPVTTIHEAVVKDDAFLVKVTDFNLGTAGTEGSILLIRNPGGSGATLYIHTLGINNSIKTQTAKINIYKIPTITLEGTAETKVNQLVGSATASVMNVFSSPTISSNGTLLYTFATGSNQNDLRRNFFFGAALPPGFDYLITGEGSNNNTLIDVSFEWAEV